MNAQQHLRAGKKYDQGKTQPDLILRDMSQAIMAVAEVASFGADKCTVGGEDAINNYRNAKHLHMLFGSLEKHDKESGLLHAAHEAWNALAVLELMLRQGDETRVDTIERNYEHMVGDYIPELGGQLIGFANNSGIIMSDASWHEVDYSYAIEVIYDYNSWAVTRRRGFADWRVPTKDELNLAWINREKLKRLNMSESTYWSSTELSTDYMWAQHFGGGGQYDLDKLEICKVRPVRSVSISELTNHQTEKRKQK